MALLNPDTAGGFVPKPQRPKPPAAPAAPASSLATPGYTPNYNTLLQSDPAYLAYMNQRQEVGASSAAKRQAALRSLAIQYGGLPAGMTDKYGDLNQGVLDLAKNNQFSTLAGIQRDYTKNVLDTKRALAARGALHSGELGYGLGQADLAHGQAEYNAAQQAMGTANQSVGDYLSAIQRADSGLPDVVNQALNNVRKAYPATSGGQAHLVPGWQGKYGHPVYQGGDGQLWTVDANGRPTAFTPPAVQASRIDYSGATVPGYGQGWYPGAGEVG